MSAGAEWIPHSTESTNQLTMSTGGPDDRWQPLIEIQTLNTCPTLEKGDEHSGTNSLWPRVSSEYSLPKDSPRTDGFICAQLHHHSRFTETFAHLL